MSFLRSVVAASVVAGEVVFAPAPVLPSVSRNGAAAPLTVVMNGGTGLYREVDIRGAVRGQAGKPPVKPDPLAIDLELVQGTKRVGVVDISYKKPPSSLLLSFLLPRSPPLPHQSRMLGHTVPRSGMSHDAKALLVPTASPCLWHRLTSPSQDWRKKAVPRLHRRCLGELAQAQVSAFSRLTCILVSCVPRRSILLPPFFSLPPYSSGKYLQCVFAVCQKRPNSVKRDLMSKACVFTLAAVIVEHAAVCQKRPDSVKRDLMSKACGIDLFFSHAPISSRLDPSLRKKSVHHVRVAGLPSLR
jgi:hypothetical protein